MTLDSLSWLPPVMKMPVARLSGSTYAGDGGLGAVLGAYAEDLGRPEPGEQGLVDLDDLGPQRAGGRDHRDPGLAAPGAVDELLEDGALAELVLGPSDDEEVTDPARRTH